MRQGLRDRRDHAPFRRCETGNATPASDRSPVVAVAVVAVWRPGDHGPEVLLTRRPAGVHLGRSWELPGGKIEPGEDPQQAARRELLEETGMAVRTIRPIARHRHGYPDKTVDLHGFLACVGKSDLDAAAGRLADIEHRWVSIRELPTAELPQANAPITEQVVRALRADER